MRRYQDARVIPHRVVLIGSEVIAACFHVFSQQACWSIWRRDATVTSLSVA